MTLISEHALSKLGGASGRSGNCKEKANEWGKQYGDCFDWISTPFEEMRLMYHDFGIVRQSKELIRHRVFITKLVPGSEEEYKARHDVLVDARGDKVTEGPDSNFSIWNAGGYIFGYNEIDTTMERDRTEEDRLEGHSLGVNVSAGYYDIGMNFTGNQGEFVTAGVDYLYALPVCKDRLHLEFNLGIGYIYSHVKPYDVFEEGGKAFKEGYIKKFHWVGPVKAGVSLVVPITVKNRSEK